MTNLIKYEAACRALQEAVAVDEVKDLRDKADAMRIYAMQAKNKALEVDAAEIRIRAERRLGEMIAAQKADGGLNTGVKMAGNLAGGGQGSPAVVANDRRPKLSDAGISKDLSSRAQKLAAVPEAEFESEVGEWRDRVKAEGARVTTRLEQAGERAIKSQPQPEYSEADDDGPSAEEIAFLDEFEKANQRAFESIVALADEDDKLAGALRIISEKEEEIARLKAELRVVKEARDGHMSSKNEAIRMVKSLQRKLAQAERESA